MLKSIIYKEIADNIRNLRFTVGSLLIIIVSFICVVILTSQYNDEIKEYHQSVNEQNATIERSAHTNRLGGMITPIFPPSKFHPIILGIDQNVEINNYNNNPLNTMFPPFDFIIIVTILMSLLAILFSYNSISGEAEDGTLRLILSNAVPRMLLLTGKWIGGVICIFIPFIISILLMSVYISLSPVVQWFSYHWLTFALLTLASLLFISIFYLIGLTVSCYTKNSTMSMLVSLFIWVLFILIIPNLSPYFAAQLYKMPSVNRIEKEVKRLQGIERDDLGRKLSKEVYDKYMNEYPEEFAAIQSMNQNQLMEYFEQRPDIMQVYNKITEEVEQAWRTANQIQNEKASKIMADIKAKSERQVATAKNIAALSPYSCYVYIATDMTGTGMHKTEYNEQLFTEASAVFRPYLERKVKEAKEKDPLFNSESYIDLSDRPRFDYKEELLNTKFAATMPYWFILLAFNALFLILAYLSFRRYDVR
ncbi:MAG: ABC transporter permease [Prevotellaceae bacterium]|jgi:ABC-type transport system involved in multi-copper enzyme maturation permease subunit|nr:ABC transporter permease [Prevotellaceae bacterium]